jgi:hypothetical protein
MQKLKSLINRKQLDGWGPTSAVIVSVIIFFFSQIIAGLIVSIYPFLIGYNSLQTKDWMNKIFTQFLLVLLVEILVILIVFWFLKRRNRKPKDIGLIQFKLRDVLYALAGFGIYFVGFVIIAILINILLPNVNLDQHQQIGFENTKSGMDLVIVFTSLVILPPVAEEILCRGFLYTGLRSKMSFMRAGLITSIIFAAAHLQFGSDAPLLWVAAIDTFVLSIVLVYLREKTGSLWASILLHGLKNSLAYVYLFIIR